MWRAARSTAAATFPDRSERARQSARSALRACIAAPTRASDRQPSACCAVPATDSPPHTPSWRTRAPCRSRRRRGRRVPRCTACSRRRRRT